jgi:hypothetical protein
MPSRQLALMVSRRGPGGLDLYQLKTLQGLDLDQGKPDERRYDQPTDVLGDHADYFRQVAPGCRLRAYPGQHAEPDERERENVGEPHEGR